MAPTSNKKRQIIGNWKAYIETSEAARDTAKKLRRRLATSAVPANRAPEVAIAAPFTLIPELAKALKGSSVRLASQTLSQYEGGAHTGDVTAAMLKAFDVSLVIIGHSERRAAGETDAVIRAQVSRAAAAGLRSVLCIGEKERDEHGAHFETLSMQLREALADVPKTALPKLVVAYEPVWAIGKSAAEAITPNDLREAVIFIKKELTDAFGREIAMKIPIIYGGSVEVDNAGALMDGGDVTGLLVGRASADAESFAAIIKACQK